MSHRTTVPSTSMSRPPRMRPRHAPNPASLSSADAVTHPTIYLSAFATAHHAPHAAAAAAYAVVSPPSTEPLAEPLASRRQTHRAALLTAFEAALRMGLSLPAYRVMLVVDDPELVAAFRVGDDSRHTDQWRIVRTLSARYRDADIDLQVVADTPDDCPSLQLAKELAQRAIHHHAFCRWCRRYYGRAGVKHDCHPVCHTAPCRGFRFPSVIDYEAHVEERHPIAVVQPETTGFMVARPLKGHTSDDSSGDRISLLKCPQCQKCFCELGAFEKHVEESCPKALERWFSNTKIVKM